MPMRGIGARPTGNTSRGIVGSSTEEYMSPESQIWQEMMARPPGIIDPGTPRYREATARPAGYIPRTDPNYSRQERTARPGRNITQESQQGSFAATGDAVFQQEMQRAQQALNERRVDLEAEVARGNISIGQANLALQRYTADLNARLQKFRAETERKLGLGQIGVERELGLGTLKQRARESTEEGAWRRQLLRQMMGLTDSGTTTGTNWATLEESLYRPAETEIQEQLGTAMGAVAGQGVGAGYGGRSSWEERQRTGLMRGAMQNIGAVRSQASVQATRARLEEAEAQRQHRARMAAAVASLR